MNCFIMEKSILNLKIILDKLWEIVMKNKNKLRITFKSSINTQFTKQIYYYYVKDTILMMM